MLLAALISASIINPSENKYFIQFHKIDNQAKIYVQDSLIFESELIDGNPTLNLKVQLDKYLKKGDNRIRVELYNGSGDGFFEFDEHWEIYYEIFENDIPIDYLNEKSSNGKNGLVLTMNHEIFVPTDL